VQAAAVRAGGDFTLALSTTGKMYAWGDNALGQLGNGSTTSRKKPVLVHLPTGVKVTSISAGSLSALALTRSGRVGRERQRAAGHRQHQEPAHARLHQAVPAHEGHRNCRGVLVLVRGDVEAHRAGLGI
jgi:alpha-tubulin suppressor-like RCC1 family protein